MPVESQNAAHPVVGACEITRCRTYLDELSTVKPAREELSVICAYAGPIGTDLGAVYAKCGGQT